MHLRQRQRRTKEDESLHLAAPRLEVFDTVGKPLPTSFQSGTDLAVIALWLGHSSPATTHQYLDSRELHQTGERTTDLRQLAG
jgi:hypothetical protein